MLDELKALKMRVALQSALIQRLLAAEDICFNAAIACEKDGQGGTEDDGDGVGHASPVLQDADFST
eukprot:2451347-Karenia_brevis.AAC.1